MSMSRNHGSSSSVNGDVEDQIARFTLSTVNSTKAILAQVEERSLTLKTSHQLIATNFFDAVAKDLTQKTNATIQNIDQMVEQTVHEINEEIDMFEKGVSEGFDGFVNLTIEKLQEIKNSANAENDDEVITKLIVEAADAITMLLKDTEQMYLFYSRYLTSVLESKLQNTTDKMSMLLHSQRRFIAAKNIDRINLCYNVSTQNTKMSRLLKSILDSMSAIGQTIDNINGLKSIHQTKSDEHAQLVSKSKSALSDTMESSRLTLDQLLKDDFCYLGSAVRKMTQQRHGSFKQALLKNLTTTVESLASKWDAATSDFRVIRGDQRLRIAKDLLNSIQSMMDVINAKARRHGKNEELEKLNAVKSSLMKKFDEMTVTVNSIFEKSQTFTSESLHNYLRFTIDRQLASLPSLSVQNFIPDDLCPLAMNYQAYIAFTLNTAMGRRVPDVIDELFAITGVSNENDDNEDVGQTEPASDESGIVMVLTIGDEETDTSGESEISKFKAAFPGLDDSQESAESQFAGDFMNPDLSPLINDLIKNTKAGTEEMQDSIGENTKPSQDMEGKSKFQ